MLLSNKRGFFIKVIRILWISDDVLVIIRKVFIECIWLKGKRIYWGIGLVDFFIGIDYVCLYIGEIK